MQVDQKLQKYAKNIKPTLNPYPKAQSFHQSSLALNQHIPTNQIAHNAQHVQHQKTFKEKLKTSKKHDIQYYKYKNEAKIPLAIADPLTANLSKGDVKMRALRTSWALVGGKSSRPLDVPLSRFGAKEYQNREKRSQKRQKEAEENHLRRMGQLRQNNEPQFIKKDGLSRKFGNENCSQTKSDDQLDEEEFDQNPNERFDQSQNVQPQNKDISEHNINSNDDGGSKNDDNSNNDNITNKQNQSKIHNSACLQLDRADKQNSKIERKRERTIEDVQQERTTKQLKLLQQGFEQRINRDFGLNVNQLQNVSVEQLPTFNENFENIDPNIQLTTQHNHNVENVEEKSEMQRSQQATHDSNSPQKVNSPIPNINKVDQQLMSVLYVLAADVKVQEWLDQNWEHLKPDGMPIEYVQMLMQETDIDIESQSMENSSGKRSILGTKRFYRKTFFDNDNNNINKNNINSNAIGLKYKQKEQNILASDTEEFVTYPKQVQLDWNLFEGNDLKKKRDKKTYIEEDELENQSISLLDWTLSGINDDEDKNTTVKKLKQEDRIRLEQVEDYFKIGNCRKIKTTILKKDDDNFESRKQSKGNKHLLSTQIDSYYQEVQNQEIDWIQFKQDLNKLDEINLDDSQIQTKQGSPLKRIDMVQISIKQQQQQSSPSKQSIDLSQIVDEINGECDQQTIRNQTNNIGTISSPSFSPALKVKKKISSPCEFQASVEKTLQLSLASPKSFNQKYQNMKKELDFMSDFNLSENNASYSS